MKFKELIKGISHLLPPAVDKLVKKDYGHNDGEDLCCNLIEQSTVNNKEHSIKQPALFVDQPLEQS